MLYPIDSVLPIFAALDGATLSPQTFSEVCKSCGWDEPRDDGIGLWEVRHPTVDTLLVLDTVTRPVTLLCSLDSHDTYEPEALLDGALRPVFDEISCGRCTAQLGFRDAASGTYALPYNWHFVHFEVLIHRSRWSKVLIR
jgi:hypothetical protein